MKQCTITNSNLGQWLLSGSGMDYVPDYHEQEQWKQQYGVTLQAFEKGEANLDDLVLAAEGRLRAWFFRSAGRFSLIHPRFMVYVFMLLKEEHIRNCFPVEIVERLVEKYGRRQGDKKVRGIIDGSYWEPAR